jgi:hypothetical protein
MSRYNKPKKRLGSSGRTRTYNPPVNSCTDSDFRNIDASRGHAENFLSSHRGDRLGIQCASLLR